MPLYELALAAILSFPGTAVPADRPRFEELAHAIADAVADRENANDWIDGAAPMPFSPELAVLALAAVARHEGGLRPEVADCRVTGDRLPHHGPSAGRAVGSWQIQKVAWAGHTRREVCGNPELGARLALAHLARQSTRSARRAFAGYSGAESQASREICAIWQRLAWKARMHADCRKASSGP